MWGTTGNEGVTAMWKKHFEAFVDSSKNSNMGICVNKNLKN